MASDDSKVCGCFAELFTAHYQVTGRVMTSGRPMASYLNDQAVEWVLIQSAGVNPFPSSEKSYAASALAQVRRASILLVIPGEPAEGRSSSELPEARQAAAPGVPVPVILYVPPYEIKGTVGAPGREVPDFLASPGPFVAVADATVRLQQGSPVFSAPCLLVNRECAQVVRLDKTP